MARDIDDLRTLREKERELARIAVLAGRIAILAGSIAILAGSIAVALLLFFMVMFAAAAFGWTI
jgi:hypothetical protein